MMLEKIKHDEFTYKLMVMWRIESAASDVYRVVQKFLLVFKYSEDALVCSHFYQLCMQCTTISCFAFNG